MRRRTPTEPVSRRSDRSQVDAKARSVPTSPVGPGHHPRSGGNKESNTPASSPVAARVEYFLATISDLMRHYIGGLKKHAGAIAAITNPLVNSYKRLVPGYEAPVNIAWSRRNRSPLIRVPERRGTGTRVEFRMPDPSCNPYLALAVQLAAGLDGLKHEIDPGPPVDTNVWKLSEDERRQYQMDSLPANLKEAVEALERDEVLTSALGEHILFHFIEAKKKEWTEYIAQVSQWELDTYLATY